MSESSESHIAVTEAPILVATDSAGRMSLYALKGADAGFIGTFEDVTALWAALDKLDEAA